MRLLFYFLLGLLAYLPASAVAAGPLVFLEIYPDDGASTRRSEYLQIVNISDEPVMFAGWALTTKRVANDPGGLVRFPEVGHLRPGQSLVIAYDEGVFTDYYPDARVDAHISYGGLTNHLSIRRHAVWGPGGEFVMPPPEKRLQIVAPDGTVSDAVTWGSAPTPGMAHLPERSSAALSWRRDFVDANGPAIGPWLVGNPAPGSPPNWTCGSALCGNGELESGEECDDGNVVDGDGCSSTCTIESGARCEQSDLPCGGDTPRPTDCYFPARVCEQELRLTAVHVSTEEGEGYWCQDWIEFQNIDTVPMPLGAVRLSEAQTVGPSMRTGFDAFAPSERLAPGERALVLDRLNPPLSVQARYTTEHCQVDPRSGFRANFGDPPVRWYARWTASPDELSARWDDYVDRHSVILNDIREQVTAYCADSYASFDTFAYAREGAVDEPLPAGWIGPRVRWYPELLRYNIVQDLVFRRFPEHQDTDTKADWHLSRCPRPGLGSVGLEAPIQGANVQKQLPADGGTVRVVLSEEARQRTDGQIWMTPPNDTRAELLAEEGSILFRGVNEPAIFELEWFALTPCWVSEKFTASIRFGDAVRCYPDADGDGFGDGSAAGVIVGGSCEPGFVTNADDCDDSDAAVHPGATEVCDGIDNDCNPGTPDGANERWFQEACDGNDDDLCKDGQKLCIFGQPYCLETGPPKLDYCDGIDNDCNPATPDGYHDPRVGVACDGGDKDLCQDGLTICAVGAVVCDEITPPGRKELCDGVDNDCNPGTPDGYDEPEFGQRCTVGVGACQRSGAFQCSPPQMTCSVRPGQPAADDVTCDGVDDDCNGLVDDGVPTTPIRCGVGACAAVGVERCEDGRFVAECTPGKPSIESFESGTCNDGIDNDCDGLVDEDDPECQPLRVCYYDADGDGYPGTAVELRLPDCDGEWEGHALWDQNLDCNDDPTDPCAAVAWNGATERCDGCDNDCNGRIDETFPSLGARCDDRTDRCIDRRWECSSDSESLRCGTAKVPEGIAEEESMAAGTCNDGVDNDCNGLTDYADPQCELSMGGGRVGSCASTGGNSTPFAALTLLLVGLALSRRRRGTGLRKLG